jgi:pyridoxine 4-dehydrogenase
MMVWSVTSIFVAACCLYLSTIRIVHVLGLAAASSTTTFSRKKAVVGRVSAGPIDISTLGCGTWSWGNKLLWDYDPSQDEEIYRAYCAIRDAGVTLFDTADSYGTLELNGRAEILLGRFERRYQDEERPTIQQSSLNTMFDDMGNFFLGNNNDNKLQKINNNRQQVATKFAPYPWRISRGSLLSAARESLKRLEQDKLCVAQLHWSTANYQPFQEGALWEGIADIYDAGLCEAVGISNYGPLQLTKFSERMKQRNVPIAIAQVQYSLMTARNNEILDACDNAGCRLISYSPLCLGLLTCKYDLNNLPRPGNPRRQLFRELLPSAQPLLDTLKAVAKDVNKTPSQVAINWAICKGTVPIPGARNLAQAEENIGSVGWKLSNAAVIELDVVSAGLKKNMIENIFQTR